MNIGELQKILNRHKLWLIGDVDGGGVRADLRGVDLRGVDLCGTDLCGTDLCGADLSVADLRGVDLCGVDLRGVDLRGANLRGANLSVADLRGVDLCGVDLRGVDLSDAKGNFCTGCFGRHHAIAAGGYISIGCELHTYQEWLDNGIEIGKRNDYTDDEIADYMDWIRISIRAMNRMEHSDA